MNIRRLFGDKGQYIGSVTETQSGVQRAFSNTGKYLGSYNPTANQTYTDKGSRTNFGNGVDSLVFRNQGK